MWVLLHYGLPPDAIYELGKVVYPGDADQAARNYGFKEPIDAFIDGGQLAVYPTEKRICTKTAQPITPLQTYEAGDVLNFFRQGVAFPESAEVRNDAKLRLALELWGAYFTEASANAKFLTLVMVLEALATCPPRAQRVLDLLDKWKAELEDLRRTVGSDSEDARSLAAVRGGLLFQKKVSIGQSIRTLVLTTLQANGDIDAGAMATKTGQVYRHRSTLVHEGQLRAYPNRPAW